MEKPYANVRRRRLRDGVVKLGVHRLRVRRHWQDQEPGHDQGYGHAGQWLELHGAQERQAIRLQGRREDLYEPTRALMRMIAADGPWAKTLLPIAKTRPFNETMEGLYALLSPICAAVDIWETTYLHAMPDVAAIVEWMEPTRLAP